jgi:hypothetical protein
LRRGLVYGVRGALGRGVAREMVESSSVELLPGAMGTLMYLAVRHEKMGKLATG